ncbi:ABC transporter permease [Paracoccus onubensis]|uniref:ABC transporter permease n=1 Tax=Paracoccus onubensis TaxID=1675788 RepID=A0A418SUH0_9RHOB|nr:ABC transporter permease [Paracoccus onubensis]RJE84560.1 ABC transporter permease [Paracoccus onubensis]
MRVAAQGGYLTPRRRRRLREALVAIASIGVTLLGLVALTFFIGRMLPLDPVIKIVGENAPQAAYDRVYRELGLDQPLIVQFLGYLKSAVTLDLGNSLTSGRPVLEDIGRVFPATIELATVAMVIGTGLGVPLGVLSAMYANSWIDHVVRTVCLIGYSAPNFWLGLMGLMIFYAGLGWVSGPGRIDFVYEYGFEQRTGLLLIDTIMAGNWDAFRNAVSHIVLPAAILAFSAMTYISRMTRSFMAAQLTQEYIITARVKGLSWRRTVWRHAFRNIAVQVLTVIALSYAFLLEGAVLTETVFAWPGFGRYLTSALLAGDMNAVVGCTLIIGLIFVTINLICDVLYRVLDPRTR